MSSVLRRSLLSEVHQGFLTIDPSLGPRQTASQFVAQLQKSSDALRRSSRRLSPEVKEICEAKRHLHSPVRSSSLHDTHHCEMAREQSEQARTLDRKLDEENREAMREGQKTDEAYSRERCRMLARQLSRLRAAAMKKEESLRELDTEVGGNSFQIGANDVASKFTAARSHKLNEAMAQLEEAAELVHFEERTKQHMIQRMASDRRAKEVEMRYFREQGSRFATEMQKMEVYTEELVASTLQIESSLARFRKGLEEERLTRLTRLEQRRGLAASRASASCKRVDQLHLRQEQAKQRAQEVQIDLSKEATRAHAATGFVTSLRSPNASLCDKACELIERLSERTGLSLEVATSRIFNFDSLLNEASNQVVHGEARRDRLVRSLDGLRQSHDMLEIVSCEGEVTDAMLKSINAKLEAQVARAMKCQEKYERLLGIIRSACWWSKSRKLDLGRLKSLDDQERSSTLACEDGEGSPYRRFREEEHDHPLDDDRDSEDSQEEDEPEQINQRALYHIARLDQCLEGLLLTQLTQEGQSQVSSLRERVSSPAYPDHPKQLATSRSTYLTTSFPVRSLELPCSD